MNHQFIKVGPDMDAQKSGRRLYGAEVVCALCGEVRHLWGDGLVEFVIKGNESHDEHNSNKAGNS